MYYDCSDARTVFVDPIPPDLQSDVLVIFKVANDGAKVWNMRTNSYYTPPTYKNYQNYGYLTDICKNHRFLNSKEVTIVPSYQSFIHDKY